MPDKLQLIYVADVFCPWCYGFAPIIGRLAEENPHYAIMVIGGNLISKPMTLVEDGQNSPGLADFWREVEHVTGRSLAGAISALEEGRDVRLYSPGADEILAVLGRLAPGHSLGQLFELEDLFYGQGRDMFTESALTEIAAAWQVDAKAFDKALDADWALKATENNLEEAALMMGEINSYPAILLKEGDRIAAVTRGYVHYETVKARLEAVAASLGVPPIQELHCSRKNGCTLGRH